MGLILVLVSVPVYVQLNDLNSRYKISEMASKVKTSNLFTELNFNALVQNLTEIDDAGYRNQMALNFYYIGECRYGDIVFKMMQDYNPAEARLRGLSGIRENCRQG